MHHEKLKTVTLSYETGLDCFFALLLLLQSSIENRVGVSSGSLSFTGSREGGGNLRRQRSVTVMKVQASDRSAPSQSISPSMRNYDSDN